jgi:uncharacterized protein (UPF0332 family)
MNGRDFLPLAQMLVRLGTEPAWRTAVSRAYYAAFHVARDFIEDLGFAVPAAQGAHAYLFLRLQNCGDPALANAGQLLQGLRHERNTADYEPKFHFRPGMAPSSLRRAEHLIQVLDSSLGDLVRLSLVRNAIRLYERDTLKQVTWRP